MQPESIIPKDRLARVPSHMHEGIQHYVENGRPTGAFLQALLSGDTVGAGLRADPQNMNHFTGWIQLLEALPPECHGSPEAYRHWINRGGYRGRAA